VALLGTAQIDNLPLARMASVTGVYGVSFEIALVNTVFAATMLVRRKRRMPLLVAALSGAIALQTTALVKVEASEVEAHATLVQQNVPIERRWTYGGYKRLMDELSAVSRSPRRQRIRA